MQGFRASTLLFDVPGRFTRYKAGIQGDPAMLEGTNGAGAHTWTYRATLPLDPLGHGVGPTAWPPRSA